MGIKELIGEVDGKSLIDIGDVVRVTLSSGIAEGRLNEVSEKEIKVGCLKINIEDIVNLKKF